MMFSELEKVMDYSIAENNYFDSLELNVTGKKSGSGRLETAKFLTRLYSLDEKHPSFTAFQYFWKMASSADRSLMAFIYAVNHDNLLAESVEVIGSIRLGEKVFTQSLEENIEKYHSKKYAPSTLRSIAQNIASSWKQARFIEGKVKNIRVQPEINFKVACFAFLLAYLKGDRGDYIWSSVGVKSLGLSEDKLRILAIECSKKDLVHYQHAGGVTSFSFKELLNKIGIHESEN